MPNYVYCCRKCGMCIQTQSQPSGAGCPNGGSHSWTRSSFSSSTDNRPLIRVK